VRKFDWWLFPKTAGSNRETSVGLAILAVLFICEIGFFEWLFTWRSSS
jgi:hypothetical protein